MPRANRASRMKRRLLIPLLAIGMVAACTSASPIARGPTSTLRQSRSPSSQAAVLAPIAAVGQAPGFDAPDRGSGAGSTPLPAGGVLDVYAAARSTTVRADLADIPERVYVPNSVAGTMDVIDPRTYRVVNHLRTGRIPYHITPAWDLTKLYIDNELSGSLQVVDPASGAISGTLPVAHPYNLYFTPDGTRAIVVDERQRSLLFEDPNTWTVLGRFDVPWAGVDHLDFSGDGSYLLASCEFSGAVVKVDVKSVGLAGMVSVGGKPIDVRLSPDGSVFYVANQGRSGVSVIDPGTMKEVGFIATGRGAHGLQVSRDARSLYVSNRLAGTISVIDFALRTVTATWGTGGSPDMMQISPAGAELWVSARFASTVYVVNTTSGAVMHRIAVGASPHGLTYFPNPGRFSLGHNGVYR